MGIGSILVERGLISDDDQPASRRSTEQNRTGERLDHVLVRLGFVSSGQVLEAIGHQFAMPIVDLARPIEVESRGPARSLPAKLVFKQRCVPLETSQRHATGRDLRSLRADRVRRAPKLLTGMGIELVLADEQDIRKFIRPTTAWPATRSTPRRGRAVGAERQRRRGHAPTARTPPMPTSSSRPRRRASSSSSTTSCSRRSASARPTCTSSPTRTELIDPVPHRRRAGPGGRAARP